MNKPIDPRLLQNAEEAFADYVANAAARIDTGVEAKALAQGARVGISRPHESAALHVAGEATYVDDIPELTGTLHCALGLSPVVCVVMGVLTATFGGIIRDVLANEPSILLRRELYISAALVSASIFIVLRTLGVDWTGATAIAVTLGFIVRAGAIAWKWRLPAFEPPKGKP